MHSPSPPVKSMILSNEQARWDNVLDTGPKDNGTHNDRVSVEEGDRFPSCIYHHVSTASSLGSPRSTSPRSNGDVYHHGGLRSDVYYLLSTWGSHVRVTVALVKLYVHNRRANSKLTSGRDLRRMYVCPRNVLPFRLFNFVLITFTNTFL